MMTARQINRKSCLQKLILINMFFQLFLFAGIQYSFAQNEGMQWYFGAWIFMDFRTQPPSVSNDAGISTFEASTALSDKSGNLLFYSNGYKIMNREKKYVKGFILQGGYWDLSPQIAQGALLLPVNDTLVYSFTIVYDSSNSYSLYRTDINPVLDSGRGEMIMQLLKMDSNITEKMQACRHANGKDWWLLVHRSGNNEYSIFHLEESGGTNHKLVATGNVHAGNSGVQTVMKFNSSGNLLAAIYGKGRVEICSFDRCKGEIEAIDSLLNTHFLPQNYPYGLSFSPNGKLLYLSPVYTGVIKLYQYALDSPNIATSEILIWEKDVFGDWETIGAHEIAPDGNIYLVHFHPSDTELRSYLSVITAPNSRDTACNFIPYGFHLEKGYTGAGLPNIPNYRLGPIYKQPADAGPDRYLCANESVILGVPDTSGGRCLFWWSPAWGLDDPTLAQPTYTNLGIDTFFVLTVTDTSVQSQCNSTTDTVWVFHELPFTISPSPDAEICEDKSVIIGLQPQAGLAYLWDPVTGLADPEAATTMAAPGMPMQYVLTITDTAMKSSCRSVADTVNVDIAPCYLPGVIAPGDQGFMQKLEISGIPPETHLTVYDITGRLVYRSYDYQNDWPAEDNYAAAGLYIYMVEFAVDPFGPLEKREVRKLVVRR